MKITFPNYWTNSCCSHQLDIPNHKGLEGSISLNHLGSEIAAIERLKFELNIVVPQGTKLNLVTKILYSGQYNDEWGESERNNFSDIRESIMFIF